MTLSPATQAPAQFTFMPSIWYLSMAKPRALKALRPRSTLLTEMPGVLLSAPARPRMFWSRSCCWVMTLTVCGVSWAESAMPVALAIVGTV